MNEKWIIIPKHCFYSDITQTKIFTFLSQINCFFKLTN